MSCMIRCMTLYYRVDVAVERTKEPRSDGRVSGAIQLQLHWPECASAVVWAVPLLLCGFFVA